MRGFYRIALVLCLALGVSCGDDRKTNPVPDGACCFADGSCRLINESDCLDDGGDWLGIDPACDPNPCPQPDGACCFADGSCRLINEPGCLDDGGNWHGVDMACDPNPCPQPIGACCLADGSCHLMYEASCSLADGNWMGYGTRCRPNPCPQPEGACCFADGTCLLMPEAVCLDDGGNWLGIGTTCIPNPCPQPAVGTILIQPGVFTMGSPTGEPGRGSDEDQHQVTLTRPFYLGIHEVTQAEWQAVMGWNNSHFRGSDRPVETVTWYDCIEFCNRRSQADGLQPAYTMTNAVHDGNHITSATVTWDQNAGGYRLPTEAEWEYACRAGSFGPLANGWLRHSLCVPLDPGLDAMGWYCGNSGNRTHDVGLKAPNNWMLYDMHGNVREWCWDWYAGYASGPVVDPVGPASGSERVARGGGWGGFALFCRSACRFALRPGVHVNHVGLRLAMTAE